MATPLRCKITGHDRDPCGVCRRCGVEKDTAHEWVDVERDRACYRKTQCSNCSREREIPDHDWQPAGTSPTGDVAMKCGRCGLAI